MMKNDLFVLENKEHDSPAHQTFLIKTERLEVTTEFLA